MVRCHLMARPQQMRDDVPGRSSKCAEGAPASPLANKMLTTHIEHPTHVQLEPIGTILVCCHTCKWHHESVSSPAPV